MAGALSGCPCRYQVFRHWSHLQLLFPDLEGGTELKTEQRVQKVLSVWDASVSDNGFTCCHNGSTILISSSFIPFFIPLLLYFLFFLKKKDLYLFERQSCKENRHAEISVQWFTPHMVATARTRLIQRQIPGTSLGFLHDCRIQGLEPSTAFPGNKLDWELN